jgi:hypothetical protein
MSVWDALCTAQPEVLCARTGVTYDAARHRYLCRVLGQPVVIDLRSRQLTCESLLGKLMLERRDVFARLAILNYLVHVRNLAPAGRWVTPAELGSGPIYLRGSHILPTDEVAATFANAPDRFLERGRQLGGELLDYGDAAIRLLPLPRLPAGVVLWTADDEFPARISLLLDAACEKQVQADVVWAAAMLTLLMFTEDQTRRTGLCP